MPPEPGVVSTSFPTPGSPFDPTLRLYAIVRGDLGMSVGKTVAQAGHAYVGAILGQDTPESREYG